MSRNVLSQTVCALGEGPLWHPERETLFWFDILGRRLFEHDGTVQRQWDFDREVSAAGWIDRDRLLVASNRDLFVLDLTSAAQTHLVDLEADNPLTRSNDGRADPFGGFWIGTMGYNCEPGAGSIYRYHKGVLTPLFRGISVSNSICFTPDATAAYFSDTEARIVRKVALDAEGWPSGEPEDWLDLREDDRLPDGAVVDADGNFWNAQWRSGRVACYAPDGTLQAAFRLPASQTTCPAFGGPGLTRLFVTSAAHGAEPGDAGAGQTFFIDTLARGQREHRVIL